MNQGKEDLGTRHVTPSYILPLKDKKYIYIYVEMGIQGIQTLPDKYVSEE